MFMADVRRFYDEHAEYEWSRLFQDAYHRLEWIVTWHFLDKYLPDGGFVLDAGGGPGRYAIELARRGYDVMLVDLSPKCLEVARKEIKKAGVEHKVKGILQGSIVDLTRFKGDSFDAVLCLGPLSHLTEKSDREKAADELVRVCKRGAPLFISVINRYGVYRTILQRFPEELTDPLHQELFLKGIHRAHFHPKEKRKGFTDAYFFHPEELKGLFESRGIKTLEIASCEGLSSHLQEATNRIYEDKEGWNMWIKIILQTCNDPVIIGMGEHTIYVGRKT
jgi:2-polyprenyl-3-methyl-5-hydroxy-6-metoxy-1,4-benzoquinol methylase